MRYHLTPVQMTIIKKKKNLQTVNTGEDVKKREPSCTVGGNIFVTAIIENRMEIS